MTQTQRPIAALPPATRRWIVRKALLQAALVNAALSASAGWIMLRHVRGLPLLAAPSLVHGSILVNTLSTLLTLPFITTLVVTPSIRRELREGRLPAFTPSGRAQTWLSKLPVKAWRRGLVLGGFCLGILGPLVGCALVATTSSSGWPGQTMLIFQMCFVVALGAIVTPIVGLMAMSESGATPTASANTTA